MQPAVGVDRPTLKLEKIFCVALPQLGQTGATLSSLRQSFSKVCPHPQRNSKIGIDNHLFVFILFLTLRKNAFKGEFNKT